MHFSQANAPFRSKTCVVLLFVIRLIPPPPRCTHICYLRHHQIREMNTSTRLEGCVSCKACAAKSLLVEKFLITAKESLKMQMTLLLIEFLIWMQNCLAQMGQTFGDISLGDTIQWLKVLTTLD